MPVRTRLTPNCCGVVSTAPMLTVAAEVSLLIWRLYLQTPEAWNAVDRGSGGDGDGDDGALPSRCSGLAQLPRARPLLPNLVECLSRPWLLHSTRLRNLLWIGGSPLSVPMALTGQRPWRPPLAALNPF